MTKVNLWNVHLLLIRLWLGSRMISGGQSILRFFSDQELRDFFENWFGKEMGFPAPLLMAFIAKGTEFFGGILIVGGLFTRISAALVGFVMLVATFADNIDYKGGERLILSDGLLTISWFLLAGALLQAGGGKFSLDQVLFKKNKGWI